MKKKLNVNGGTITLGYSTGIYGSRILVKLFQALKCIDKNYGIT